MTHLYGWSAEKSGLPASLAAAIAEARDTAARHAASVDAEGRFPEEAMGVLARGGLYGLAIDRDHGGLGQGTRAFATVVEDLATACASTAMVYVMHVAAGHAIATSKTLAGRDALLRDMAAGRHLTTLAWSEKGSRSQFWAPVSKLAEQGGGYVTDAHKSYVTSARHADSYVSSAQSPKAASPMESTLYLVRRGAKGNAVAGGWSGIGLRGNDSAPVDLRGLGVAAGDLLTEHGQGAPGMLAVLLPWFAIGSASMANGLCLAAVHATASHLSESNLENSGTKLRDLPNLRARLAAMSVRTELARSLTARALGEFEAGSETASLALLQTRIASLEAAIDVTDLAMKACGGAAFSKHLAVERNFRDARAGWVMAPTVDHLHDFVGRALTGMPLFG
jgi:alkylation response protein AidB-like acyl-CoA dehydrogenase